MCAYRPSTKPLLGQLVRIVPTARACAYDGSEEGISDAITTLTFTTPAAFLQIVRAPRGLGLARAWVTGQIDVEGDALQFVRNERKLRSWRLALTFLWTVCRTLPTMRVADIKKTGPTSVEYRASRPGTHTIKRDYDEVKFHYDLSSEFYQILLGPSLTYSCGIFVSPWDSLEDAQTAKHAVIAEKLRLSEGSIVLDVGCGWGAFLEYATKRYGCRGIGVTASKNQYDEILRRRRRHPDCQITALLADYREALPMKETTAATSIGMYEHIGAQNSQTFFGLIHTSLPRGACYVNQSIIMREHGPRRFRRNGFVQRYIFPNGQLLPLSCQLRDLRSVGFQITSVDRYGGSYVLTLQSWIRNLKANWAECVAFEGEQRVRAWYMYLLGALARFECGDIDVVQVAAKAR